MNLFIYCSTLDGSLLGKRSHSFLSLSGDVHMLPNPTCVMNPCTEGLGILLQPQWVPSGWEARGVLRSNSICLQLPNTLWVV